MHPTPTRSNVADIGTKLLSVSRTEYLLGLLKFRDASSGYDRVGEAQLDVDRNVHAIRNACKDLSKIAKADATANTARILSVILVAMQSSGALGEPDENHESNELSKAILMLSLNGFLNALSRSVRCTRHILQHVLPCFNAFSCWHAFAVPCTAAEGPTPYAGHQSSVQVHVGDGVTIDVRTNDRFSVPLRDPASAGPKAPGTFAFPLHFSSDDEEFKGDVQPYMQQSRARQDAIAAKFGARSKAMSRPVNRDSKNVSDARGSDDPPPAREAGVTEMPVPPTPKAPRIRVDCANRR